MLKRNTFTQKALIIADRGFESYNLIAHCLEKTNVDFLIRVRQSYSAMREVAKLPMMELDCTIRPTITTTQTKEDKKSGYVFPQVPKKSKAGSKTRRGRWDFSSPYPMRFRICRFLLDNGEFETVATSLPSSFTLADIKELYHLRWGIETSFRDLKYTLELVNLHGRSDAFAEQEIFASLTAFNLTSRICREVVIRQPAEGVYAYKVNFKMAVMLRKEHLRTPNVDGETLLKEIARYTIPIRPNRQTCAPRNFTFLSIAWPPDKKEGAVVSTAAPSMRVFFQRPVLTVKMGILRKINVCLNLTAATERLSSDA